MYSPRATSSRTRHPTRTRSIQFWRMGHGAPGCAKSFTRTHRAECAAALRFSVGKRPTQQGEARAASVRSLRRSGPKRRSAIQAPSAPPKRSPTRRPSAPRRRQASLQPPRPLPPPLHPPPTLPKALHYRPRGRQVCSHHARAAAPRSRRIESAHAVPLQRCASPAQQRARSAALLTKSLRSAPA